MSYDFKVGDKVVCVDDHRTFYEGGEEHTVTVRRGECYTIRHLAICEFSNDDHQLEEMLGVWLEETRRPEPDSIIGDDPFAAYRFRPLIKTSISIFREIAQGVTDGKPIIPDQQPQTGPYVEVDNVG